MNNYPHKCPECQSPAYVGFTRVECSAAESRCRHSDGSAKPRDMVDQLDALDAKIWAAIQATKQATPLVTQLQPGQVLTTGGWVNPPAPPAPPAPSPAACPDCGSSRYNSTLTYLLCRVCGMTWLP